MRINLASMKTDCVMSEQTASAAVKPRNEITRRQFVAGAAATALSFTILKPGLLGGAEANSKISLGLIGCGGRGKWIADLFEKNGHYKVAAVADYFQERADEAGQKFQVDATHRYTGLSGYRRLLEGKLDAVVIESPPYFHPEHAAAAIEAGKHVYVAKPIAVDVPGCRSIGESGKEATEKKLCFQVDFQTLGASFPWNPTTKPARCSPARMRSSAPTRPTRKCD
jgi:hypothetical protein